MPHINGSSGASGHGQAKQFRKTLKIYSFDKPKAPAQHKPIRALQIKILKALQFDIIPIKTSNRFTDSC